jgi:hypothetical protein
VHEVAAERIAREGEPGAGCRAGSAGLWIAETLGGCPWQNPPMRNARFRLVGALGCVVLSAAACTGGSSDGHGSPPPSSTAPLTTPGPSSPSPPSPTPTSTAPTVPTTGPNVSPGEKPPTLAAIGKTNTPQGATQFARYWFAALDWGYATTSSTLARELYAASCTGCAGFATNIIDSVGTQRRHYRGGRITVSGTEVVPTDRHAGAVTK